MVLTALGLADGRVSVGQLGATWKDDIGQAKPLVDCLIPEDLQGRAILLFNVNYQTSPFFSFFVMKES